ncbi:Wadjet anti-phage system protein JetD domain-containing protein [Corynebacterium sp. AOP40-9SA-29]|uniref:Wadjet anti-phage system protein JetD domain-containing protein n=1 Tax=Corynebacterium sp. AOP40-9SA-29 TaxID=3457677 RepID=UPI0040344B30
MRAKAPLSPQDAVASLRATVQRRWKVWLVAAEGQDAQDGVDLPLHPPAGAAVAADEAAAMAWVRSWQQWEKAHPEATVVWGRRAWNAAGLGRQDVPERLQVTGVDALVALSGQRARWRGLCRSFTLLVGENPEEDVRRGAAAVLTRWSELDEADLARVRRVVDWLLANPGSGLSARALPVEGVHGKWLESHRALVCRLVAAHRGDPTGASVSSLQDLGLVGRPMQVRFRAPGGVLGLAGVAGAPDVTLTWDGAAALFGGETVRAADQVSGVLMVENLETFLALPVQPGRVLVWGAGYAARQAAQLPWLADLPVWYWGDLDADGFAILSAVRSHLPQVRSVLMDTEAVRRWQHLGTADTHPDRKNLEALTAAEESARDLLATLDSLRIEQERILLSEAVEALTTAGFYE